MSSALLHGIGFGFALTIMLGPVFFGLLQTSIHKGFKYGLFFAIGVAVSDIAFILLTYFGISNFIENQVFKKIISMIGGLLMIGFGLFYFLKKLENTVPLAPIQKEHKKANFIIKGFILNILNPSVFFFWVGVVSIISIQYEDQEIYIFTFFAGSILTVLSTDIFKAYVANKIKKYFTNSLLNKLNKILGLVFLGAGISLLYQAFSGSFIGH